MARLLFEKKGNAVWISHLDLMRLFQRAFKRAGFPLKHTQGFNPRPHVTIALPLSVGIESSCELLDFELEGEYSCSEILDRLNSCLVDGIRVLDVYENGRKIKDLALLSCQIDLEYDEGIPADAQEQIALLFQRESLFMEKRNRNGVTQQDLIPMIRKLEILRQDDHVLTMDALVCCQNPTLNPAQISGAISLYLAEYAPNFSKCARLEIYDNNEKIFR